MQKQSWEKIHQAVFFFKFYFILFYFFYYFLKFCLCFVKIHCCVSKIPWNKMCLRFTMLQTLSDDDSPCAEISKVKIHQSRKTLTSRCRRIFDDPWGGGFKMPIDDCIRLYNSCSQLKLITALFHNNEAYAKGSLSGVSTSKAFTYTSKFSSTLAVNSHV